MKMIEKSMKMIEKGIKMKGFERKLIGKLKENERIFGGI